MKLAQITREEKRGNFIYFEAESEAPITINEILTLQEKPEYEYLEFFCFKLDFNTSNNKHRATWSLKLVE